MKGGLGGFVQERMLPTCPGVPVRVGIALRCVVLLTCMCAAAAFQPAAAQHLGGKFKVQAAPNVDKRQLMDLVHIRIVAKATIGYYYTILGKNLDIKYEDAKEENISLKLDNLVVIPSSTWKYEQKKLTSDEIVYGHCLKYSYDGADYVLPIRGSWIEQIQQEDKSNAPVRLNPQLYVDDEIRNNLSNESNIQNLFEKTCKSSLQEGDHVIIRSETLMPAKGGMMADEVELSLGIASVGRTNDTQYQKLKSILEGNCLEKKESGNLGCKGNMFRILSQYVLAITEGKEGEGALLAIVGRKNPEEAFELTLDSLARWTAAVGKAGEESPEPGFVKPVYRHDDVEIPISVRKVPTGIEIRVPSGDRERNVVTRLTCADKTEVEGVDGLRQVVWPKFHLKNEGGSPVTKWLLSRTESESGKFNGADQLFIGTDGVGAFRVVESFGDDQGKVRFWAHADADQFAGYKPAKVEISENDICRGPPPVVQLVPWELSLSAAMFERVAPSTKVILRDDTLIDLDGNETKVVVEAPRLKEIRLSHPNKNDLVMDFAQPGKRSKQLHQFAQILREEDDKKRCTMLRNTFRLARKHGGDIYAPGETRIAFREKYDTETAHSARKVANTDFFTIDVKKDELQVWMKGQWQDLDEELSCGFEGSGLASAYLVFDTDDFVAAGSDGQVDECANPDDLTDFEKMVFQCEDAGGSEKLSSDGAVLEAMWRQCASGVWDFLSSLDKIGRTIFVHVHPDDECRPVFSPLGDIIQSDSSAVRLFSDMGWKLRDAADRAVSVYDMGDGSAEALAKGFSGFAVDKVAPFDLVVFFRDPHAEKASVKKMGGNEKLLQQYVVSGFLRKGSCVLAEGVVALDPGEAKR